MEDLVQLWILTLPSLIRRHALLFLLRARYRVLRRRLIKRRRLASPCISLNHRPLSTSPRRLNRSTPMQLTALIAIVRRPTHLTSTSTVRPHHHAQFTLRLITSFFSESSQLPLDIFNRWARHPPLASSQPALAQKGLTHRQAVIGCLSARRSSIPMAVRASSTGTPWLFESAPRPPANKDRACARCRA
jgi:hypothetical protein